MVTCPVCDAKLDIEEDELDEGETLNCDECGADLRVASVKPLELESLEEEEDEDLDDEDEDEEEDWK
jgi:lysine biosynthesis protein LysW